MAVVQDKISKLSVETCRLFDVLPAASPVLNTSTIRLQQPFRDAQEIYCAGLTTHFFSVLLKIIFLPIFGVILFNWFNIGLFRYPPPFIVAQFCLILLLGVGIFVSRPGLISNVTAVKIAEFSLVVIFVLSVSFTVSGGHSTAIFPAFIRVMLECLVVTIMATDAYKKFAFVFLNIGDNCLLIANRFGFSSPAALSLFYQALCSIVVILGVAYFVSLIYCQDFIKTLNLYRSEQRMDRLIRSILPESVVDELKVAPEGSTYVRKFESATVLFADLVGFTKFCSESDPENIVTLLNQVFSRFDASVQLLGLEKIKTIGDAYMVAGGLPKACADHARRVLDLALELRAALEKYNHLTGMNLQIRIGVHTGPVVAGIIGRDKIMYDLWGDTVNIASRLESQGRPGEIHLSSATAALTSDFYRFKHSQLTDVKGRGLVNTCYLDGPLLHSKVKKAA